MPVDSTSSPPRQDRADVHQLGDVHPADPSPSSPAAPATTRGPPCFDRAELQDVGDRRVLRDVQGLDRDGLAVGGARRLARGVLSSRNGGSLGRVGLMVRMVSWGRLGCRGGAGSLTHRSLHCVQNDLHCRGTLPGMRPGPRKGSTSNRCRRARPARDRFPQAKTMVAISLRGFHLLRRNPLFLCRMSCNDPHSNADDGVPAGGLQGVKGQLRENVVHQYIGGGLRAGSSGVVHQGSRIRRPAPPRRPRTR